MNHVNGCQCSECLGKQITNGQWGPDFNPNGWGLQDLHRVASPVYNNRADYNTNSKSYYDYLARQNEIFTSTLIPQVNRLLRRDITFTETKSIKPTKKGSWTGKPCDCHSNGSGHMVGCACYCYDDVVDVVEDVKLSPIKEPYSHAGTTTRELPNAISIKGDNAKDPNAGLYSKDWTDVIGDIINNINNTETEAGKHTTIVKGSGINMTTGKNAKGGIQYNISSPIGDMPSGDYNLSAKEEMWSGNKATNGTAVKPFSNGSYSVRWTVNNALGFSTDISIVTATGNNNITYQTIDESGSLITYSCHIQVTGSNWTANSTFTMVESDGTVTSGATTGFSIQEISRLVNVKMHFG